MSHRIGADSGSASRGREPAPGTLGRIVVNEAGRQVFVTADGIEIPLDDGGHTVLPDAPPEGTSSVRTEDGRTLVVGVEEEKKPAATGAPPPAAVGRPPASPPPALAAERRVPARRLRGPDGRIIELDDADGPVLVSPDGTAAGEGPRLLSDEMDEIISYVPHWLIRWGISVLAVTIGVLLGISWFIRYPETVTGRVTLTTPNPAVRLVARTGAPLGRLFVADGDPVRRGDPLAVLHNPAAHEDVFELRRELAAFDAEFADPPEGAFRTAFAADRRLGDIQTAYSAFLQRLSDYNSFVEADYYGEKIRAAEAQLTDHRALSVNLRAQQSLVEQEERLAERDLARKRELASRGFLSEVELETAEMDVLRKRQAVQSGRTAITNNEIQISTYAASILDLEQQRSDERRRLLLELRSTYRALSAATLVWEQNYVIRAPAAGQVSFFRPLDENMFVAASEPLLAVVPASTEVVGVMRIPQVGAGKVRKGQRVLIRFDSYPHEEFGAVDGRVVRISGVAQEEENGGDESFYMATVALPEGLRTSFGRTLEFRQEMQGDASVVTEDLSLFQRIFSQFRRLTSDMA